MDFEKSPFLLVEWIGENKFSVISRNKIVEEDRRNCKDDDLVGETIWCVWRQKTKYEAKVLQCGEKINLDYELGVLIGSENANEFRATGTLEGDKQADTIDEVLADCFERNQGQRSTTDYKVLYEQELARPSKYKNKAKTLKRKLQEFENETREEVVTLSGQVTIKKSQLEMVKTISGSATVFARNLMRIIFTDQELNNMSLYGRKCNANTAPAKPSIDNERREAIILHTLEAFCDGRSDKGTLNDIHRSMGDYIREVTRKLQRKTSVGVSV